MSSITLYGIKSCDTMKKAMNWLNEHGIDYVFHDYKKAGIDEATLQDWLSKESHENLINRRGTTWRKLSDEQKSDVDNAKAITLMRDNTSLIKRPVLAKDGDIFLGFKPELYAEIFNK